MPTFNVIVTRTITDSQEFEIKAKNEDDAIDKVQMMVDNEVLDDLKWSEEDIDIEFEVEEID